MRFYSEHSTNNDISMQWVWICFKAGERTCR